MYDHTMTETLLVPIRTRQGTQTLPYKIQYSLSFVSNYPWGPTVLLPVVLPTILPLSRPFFPCWSQTRPNTNKGFLSPGLLTLSVPRNRHKRYQKLRRKYIKRFKTFIFMSCGIILILKSICLCLRNHNYTGHVINPTRIRFCDQ